MQKNRHLRMPMIILLVGDLATLQRLKTLDSRHKHSGMTMFFKLMASNKFN